MTRRSKAVGSPARRRTAAIGQFDDRGEKFEVAARSPSSPRDFLQNHAGVSWNFFPRETVAGIG